MTELLNAVSSWPSLLVVVIAFGFAPGFCLRLIVLAYPRTDPRRAELIAELYGVPRIQRPLWVAEQLEVALFEGLAHRVAAVLRRPRRARVRTNSMRAQEAEYRPSLAEYAGDVVVGLPFAGIYGLGGMVTGILVQFTLNGSSLGGMGWAIGLGVLGALAGGLAAAHIHGRARAERVARALRAAASRRPDGLAQQKVHPPRRPAPPP